MELAICASDKHNKAILIVIQDNSRFNEFFVY